MKDRVRIGACLSLSGRFAQFGRQAAKGLEIWRALDGNAELVIEDDCSDLRRLEEALPRVAAQSDLLLGPYSTLLMRAAGRVAADAGCLIWNHGGSGDDAEQGFPGHVVSVLTPTSRYAKPFIQYLAADADQRDLCIVHGPGRFGRQVADGALATAGQLGLHAVRARPEELPPTDLGREWDLFSSGVFEQDAEMVTEAFRLPSSPKRICAVAAGVREFAHAVSNPEGVFGVAQWFPGSVNEVAVGPSEEEFVDAWLRSDGQIPDYPAVQAAAGAVIAAHCARKSGDTGRASLWASAANLDTSTLFGGFKINPSNGVQMKHETVLVRWTDGVPKTVHV
jgi:ABC-type branched-subunit amino acid transport system substrate-binding protein